MHPHTPTPPHPHTPHPHTPTPPHPHIPTSPHPHTPTPPRPFFMWLNKGPMGVSHRILVPGRSTFLLTGSFPSQAPCWPIGIWGIIHLTGSMSLSGAMLVSAPTQKGRTLVWLSFPDARGLWSISPCEGAPGRESLAGWQGGSSGARASHHGRASGM